MKRILLTAVAPLALSGSAYAMSDEDLAKAKTIGAIAEGGRLCSADVRPALTLLASRGLGFMEHDGYTFEGIKTLMDDGQTCSTTRNGN
jgi:hypothetical protein